MSLSSTPIINPQRPRWRQSIMNQLQARKSVEQSPFEEICSYVSNMFDRIDIYKSENIQLNLQREKLQNQLLGIQQTILAGGSDSAKAILSNLSIANINEDGSNSNNPSATLNIKHAELLAEKAQLEKKILDIQEKLTDALKSKSDTVQRVVDLKTELDEKEQLNRHLSSKLDEKEKEANELRDSFDKLDRKHRTLNDEHTALSLSYKSLEKKHHALNIECDALRSHLLALKREDAERLNAENDKIISLQQERRRKEIEANIAAMTGNIGVDNFETLDDGDLLLGLNAPSRVPAGIEFAFDAHEGEVSAVYWYSCSGPRDDFLATGGIDRKVKLWKISGSVADPVATLLGSNASITSIDVEADSILASSNDYATRIWSVNDFKHKRTLTGHSAKVLSAKFLGFPNKVASGSQDRTLKIWDTNPGACLRTFFAGSCCFDLVYNNYQVISGHFDCKIRCWDLKKPNDNESVAQIALQSKITSLDVSKDGTKLLCSLRDNTIKCLDLRRMEVIQTYSDEKFKIGYESCRARFSIDGQYISCGSSDGSLYIWDTNSAKVEKVLSNHNASILACSWSPDGKRMVSIERSKKVSIWV